MLGAAAMAGLGLLHPGPAGAAPPPAAPVGDDAGYLTFGAAAEGVLARVYSGTGAVPGFSRGERALLARAHTQKRDAVDRLNAALGPDDAIPLDDFSRRVTLGTRAGALGVARRLEGLVVGVYLDAVGYAADPGSRILLGRLLAAASAHRALVSRMAGVAPPGLAAPVDLEAAGTLLDTYLEDPTA